MTQATQATRAQARRKADADMEWQKPDFIDIDMNAEIGAYQRDTGDGTDPDRIAPPEAELGAAAQPSRSSRS
jgi:hypothetical protein